MLLNSNAFSFFEAIKLVSNLNVVQLHLEEEIRSSKRLTKNDPFLKSMSVIERTMEDRQSSVDMSIETRLNHMNCAYDYIVSYVKYRMSVGD